MQNDTELLELNDTGALSGFAQDKQLYSKLKETLDSELLSDEMHHMLLALLVDLQKSYLQIKTGRDQWLSALDAMSSPVLLLDHEGRVLRANLDYAKCAGMDVHDVIGKPYWQVFPLLDGPVNYDPGEIHQSHETINELTLPSGQVFFDHGYAIKDNAEHAIYSLHVFEDITTRLKTEVSLHDREKEIRNISKFPAENPNPVLRIHRNGTILFANDSAASILTKWKREVGQKISKALSKRIAECFDSGISKEVEIVCNKRIFSCILTPILNEDYLNIYGRDVTDHKLAEQKLLNSQQLLNSIVTSAMDAILTVDNEQHIELANPAAQKMFGYTPREFSHLTLNMLIPDRFREEHTVQVAAFGKTGVTSRRMGNLRTVVGLRKNGEEFPVEVSISKNQSDGRVFYSAILRDVSERIKSEENLQNVNRSLHTLRDINQALVHCTDENMLNQEVCRILVEAGGYPLVWIGHAEQEEQKHVCRVAYAGDDVSFLDKKTVTWSDTAEGLGATGTAIKTASMVVVNDVATHPDYAPWRKLMKRHGFRSSIALPLIDDDGCFGALTIYHTEVNVFTAEVRSLLSEMVGDLSFGIAALRQRVKALRHQTQMDELIERNPDAILILDAEGNIEFANTSAEVLFGRPANQLIGMPLGLPEYQEAGLAKEIEIPRTNDDGNNELRIVELYQTGFTALEKPGTIAFLHDITLRRKAEQLNVRLGHILKNTSNEIYACHAETLKFISVSEGAQRHLCYTMEEFNQMTPVDIMPGYNHESYDALIKPLLEGLETEIHLETEHQTRDGTRYPVEVHMELSREEYPPVFISIVEDISERKRYISELEHKALYDEQTDLPNKALLDDRLELMLKIAKRETKPFAMLSVAIVHMSEINDLMGYEYGDHVLKEAAHRLLNMCRESDTVARLNSNEFVIILGSATQEFALLFAKKIQQLFEIPFVINELSLEIEVVIGIALYPDHYNEKNTLLQCSDTAMRIAKYNSLGISVFNIEDSPYSLKRLKLHGELRQAIDNNEMAIHYQPKVDLKTGRIVSLEALARWPHPQQGMIPPGEFIPMIEQSGLIRPFTLWVLEVAITQLSRWMAEDKALTIAVNLSTRNLLDAELPKIIFELLEVYRVSPDKLILEITESALMARPEQALHVIKQLHEMSLKISIDDFGTGYSSLAYLKKLPVNEIKIDQSFIFGLIENKDDEVIVRSTIDLAHNLGYTTVAEGVESEDIMEKLNLMNCDIAQGYYMSRPLPLQELQEWLQKSPWGIKQ